MEFISNALVALTRSSSTTTLATTNENGTTTAMHELVSYVRRSNVASTMRLLATALSDVDGSLRAELLVELTRALALDGATTTTTTLIASLIELALDDERATATSARRSVDVDASSLALLADLLDCGGDDDLASSQPPSFELTTSTTTMSGVAIGTGSLTSAVARSSANVGAADRERATLAIVECIDEQLATRLCERAARVRATSGSALTRSHALRVLRAVASTRATSNSKLRANSVAHARDCLLDAMRSDHNAVCRIIGTYVVHVLVWLRLSFLFQTDRCSAERRVSRRL